VASLFDRSVARLANAGAPLNMKSTPAFDLPCRMDGPKTSLFPF
jgi:hypothetical protein